MPVKKTSKYNIKRILPMAMLALSPVLFNACSDNNEDDPIVKQDVRIGWDFSNGPMWFFTQLHPDKITELKKLPTTGKISAYVTNEDGRGPPVEAVNDMVNWLVETAKPNIDKFEPSKLYVNDFAKADSIRAQNELNLTIDLWSRKK